MKIIDMINEERISNLEKEVGDLKEINNQLINVIKTHSENMGIISDKITALTNNEKMILSSIESLFSLLKIKEN
jgi:hypothetical protein